MQYVRKNILKMTNEQIQKVENENQEEPPPPAPGSPEAQQAAELGNQQQQ